MTINAHEIANLVQNLVDAKTRMDELASHVVELTGCESCYDASSYVNRAQWSNIPQFPTPSGNVSVLAANGYNIEQKAFKNALNLLLEDVAVAQNEYDQAYQEFCFATHTLPVTKDELFFYVIFEDNVYKIGYYMLDRLREPIFEKVEDDVCLF